MEAFSIHRKKCLKMKTSQLHLSPRGNLPYVVIKVMEIFNRLSVRFGELYKRCLSKKYYGKER